MQEKEIDPSSHTPRGYRGGVRLLARLWRNPDFRASAIVFAILFPLLLADRLSSFFSFKALSVKAWIVVVFMTGMWSLVGLVPLWLFGRRSRILYSIALPVEFALVCVEWFVRLHFKMLLGGSWVGIALASSWDEMRWFFGRYLSAGTCGCLAFMGLSVFFVERCLACLRRSSVSHSMVASSIAVIAFSFCCNLRLGTTHAEMIRRFPALNLIPDTIVCLAEQVKLSKMAENPDFPPSVHLQCPKQRPSFGVFVLGESATRTHWSLYGYGRTTTPEMDSLGDELIVFEDLVTPASMTSEAMRYLFSTRTLEKRRNFRYSMSQILKRINFGVELYSNQARWDQWGSDETYSFAGCNPFAIMREIGETNKYDSVLLKHFASRLDCATNRVVFLHLMGSHCEAWERYPNGEGPFGTNKGNTFLRTPIDHYDNTIWFTDKILGEIVRKLKALHKPAWMIYVSDHGETPSAKSWRTATDNDLWEIPFVVWTSPEFTAAYPERVAALRRAKDKPLQSDQLLYGLLRFMGVEGLGNAPEEDFLSDSFKPRTPRRILSGAAVYQPKTR